MVTGRARRAGAAAARHDYAGGTAENGAAMLDAVTEDIVAFLREFATWGTAAGDWSEIVQLAYSNRSVPKCSGR